MKWTQATDDNLPEDGELIHLKTGGKNNFGYCDYHTKRFLCVDGNSYPYRLVEFLDESTTTLPVEGIEDLQNQVRKHIKDHDLFDWHEALTDEEMMLLENLLLTFNPLCPPGSIGFEEQKKHIQSNLSLPVEDVKDWLFRLSAHIKGKTLDGVAGTNGLLQLQLDRFIEDNPIPYLAGAQQGGTATGGWVKAAGMKDGIYPVKFISKLSGVKMYGVGQVLNGEIPLARFYNGTTLSSSDPDVDAYVLSDTAPAIDMEKEAMGFLEWVRTDTRIHVYWDKREKPYDVNGEFVTLKELYSLYKQSI